MLAATRSAISLRKIIEAHGGQIAMQSEVGRGTQVTIKLPIPARLPADGGR
jgi:signal transduction histidine kinase